MYAFWRLGAEVIELHSLMETEQCVGPLPAAAPPSLSYLLDPDPSKKLFF